MSYVMPITWLVLFVLFIVIECLTQGLTTIWFAGGSVLGLFVASVDGSLITQLVAFTVVSLVLLIFTRPALLKLMNGRVVKTNIDTIAGETAVVKDVINNLEGTGTVYLNGMDWSARSINNDIIEIGVKVTVVKIEGVKLIVEKQKNAE